MHRRAYLAAATGAVATLSGCGGRPTEYGEWFANVDNYDGEVDLRGRRDVAVAVGAGDGFAFEPAAIRTDRATTVVWEWTGDGGRHNVVERDGAFSSPFYDDAGATFEFTFERAGLFPYFCEPHRELGMKGGVRVE